MVGREDVEEKEKQKEKEKDKEKEKEKEKQRIAERQGVLWQRVMDRR